MNLQIFSKFTRLHSLLQIIAVPIKNKLRKISKKALFFCKIKIYAGILPEIKWQSIKLIDCINLKTSN